MHTPMEETLMVSTEQWCLEVRREARPPLGAPTGAPMCGRQAGCSLGYFLPEIHEEDLGPDLQSQALLAESFGRKRRGIICPGDQGNLHYPK